MISDGSGGPCFSDGFSLAAVDGAAWVGWASVLVAVGGGETDSTGFSCGFSVALCSTVALADLGAPGLGTDPFADEVEEMSGFTVAVSGVIDRFSGGGTVSAMVSLLDSRGLE